MKIMEKFAARGKDNWNNSPVTLAFLGDSVTQGCFEMYNKGEGYLDTVFDQQNGYHHHLAKMLSVLYPNVPVNIINAGISGSNAPHGLERLEEDVLRHNPDLTVVCYGLNDCRRPEGIEPYIQALDEILPRLQKSGSEVIFMTPNMMNTYVYWTLTDPDMIAMAKEQIKIQQEGGLDRFVQAAKDICAKYNVTVCDCYEKWKTLYRNGVDVTELLSNKLNHPTREMNWLFAVSLLETMMGL